MFCKTCDNPCNIFIQRGLHFIHLNINSILPKIDQLMQPLLGCQRQNLMIHSLTEISINENRHSGGVACYVKSDLYINNLEDFQKKQKICSFY